ncbi:MAG: nucleotide exchange factor GrpE, partial [Syntrophobacteraceae bacterium]
MPVSKRPTSQSPDPEDQAQTRVGASESSEEDCRQLLLKRQEELKEAQDRILRLAAELDNTRKRLEREKSEGIAYANESIMRQLIDVIDNLERAIEHGEGNVNCEGL